MMSTVFRMVMRVLQRPNLYDSETRSDSPLGSSYATFGATISCGA